MSIPASSAQPKAFPPAAEHASTLGAPDRVTVTAATDEPGQLFMQCRRLRDGAQLPAYQTAGAAGMDLCACLEEPSPMVLLPGGRALVPTGLSVAIPDGYEGQVRPRSGWALKHGVTVLNSPGTIDSDYRGEVKILLINHGAEPVTVASGDRIAQLVIAQVARVTLREVAGLDDTARGAGGFGHTGRGEKRGG